MICTGSLSPSSPGRFPAGVDAVAFFGACNVLLTFPVATIFRGFSVTSIAWASMMRDSSWIRGTAAPSVPLRARVPAAIWYRARLLVAVSGPSVKWKPPVNVASFNVPAAGSRPASRLRARATRAPWVRVAASA